MPLPRALSSLSGKPDREVRVRRAGTYRHQAAQRLHPASGRIRLILTSVRVLGAPNDFEHSQLSLHQLPMRWRLLLVATVLGSGEAIAETECDQLRSENLELRVSLTLLTLL